MGFEVLWVSFRSEIHKRSILLPFWDVVKIKFTGYDEEYGGGWVGLGGDDDRRKGDGMGEARREKE